MAAKKVYAVRKGHKTGLFESWEECKAAVDGFPGAEYKGFTTRAEAFAYLGIAEDAEEEATVGNKNDRPGQAEELPKEPDILIT